MTNKIEELQNGVSEVKSQLYELKNNIKLSAKEKKEKADGLKSKAEDLGRQIESELSALSASTDAEAQQNIEKLLSSQEILREIQDLYASILTSLESGEEEKEGFWERTKDKYGKAKTWVVEKWNAAADYFKTEQGKSTLRKTGIGAAIVGGGALIISGIRRLFSGETKEERIQNKKERKEARKQGRKERREARRQARKERKEARRRARQERRIERSKLPFWERPIGKVIKWTGIGTIIYFIVHGLSTGKWDFGHLLNWDNNGPTSNAEENYDDYTELSHENPEKYREYEQMGENINLMYDTIRDTEKNYFGADSQIVLGAIGDKAKEQKIKKAKNFEDVETRGLVPYSLDNYFNNVGDMLSYGGVNRYITSKNIEEYKQKIKNFGAEWFDKAMVPYLSSFANFASFGIISTDTAQQKMDKYFKGISENGKDNLEILDLFFRQYTKVLTYMADKKNALALKFAREILLTKGYDNDTWPSDPEEQNEMLYEAINDAEWVEQNLKHTKYGTFLSSNIIGAYRILKEEGLDNAEMTGELKDVVQEVDEQTEEIIGGFDNNALAKAEAKLNGGETLDSSEKAGLEKVIENVIEDLGDTKTGSWFYNTFDYGFELLGLNEADRQVILKESGISKVLDEIASSIQSFKSEVLANPTKENVAQLKKLVGEYTSMKKEIAVALYAIQEAKESKDLLDYIKQVFGALVTGFQHFTGSVGDLIHLKADIGDIINVFIGMTISGGILEFGGKLTGRSFAVKMGHYTKRVGLRPVTLVEMGLGRTRLSWAVKNRINHLAHVNPTKAENLMKKNILDGVLSKRQVYKILRNNDQMKAAFNISGFQDYDRVFKEVVHSMFGETYKAEADLYIKYYRKVKGLVSYTRESFVDGGFTDGTFRMQVDTDGFKALGDFDLEFSKLGNTVQKSYFEHMLKKVGGGDDMHMLKELIQDEEFRKLITNDNIKQLKEIKIEDLRKLKAEGILDDFIHGNISLEDMIKRIPGLRKLDDIIETPIRIAFNKSIDNTISKLTREVGNPRAYEVHVNRLKALKKDASLVDDEMESFTKFINHGFDAKLLPEFKRLFELSDELKNGEKLGERLKKLLTDGNYIEFKGYLINRSYGKYFKGIQVDDIVKNFESVIGKIGKVSSATTKNVIKGFIKIFFKAL